MQVELGIRLKQTAVGDALPVEGQGVGHQRPAVIDELWGGEGDIFRFRRSAMGNVLPAERNSVRCQFAAVGHPVSGSKRQRFCRRFTCMVQRLRRDVERPFCCVSAVESGIFRL
ncbi:hypothetical protein D3C78_950900 [compost metagenome]